MLFVLKQIAWVLDIIVTSFFSINDTPENTRKKYILTILKPSNSFVTANSAIGSKNLLIKIGIKRS